jgi:hypothetical protein
MRRAWRSRLHPRGGVASLPDCVPGDRHSVGLAGAESPAWANVERNRRIAGKARRQALFHGKAWVAVDGVLAEHEALRNFALSETLGDEGQHLQLAPAELDQRQGAGRRRHAQANLNGRQLHLRLNETCKRRRL